MDDEQHVLTHRQGGVGQVILNRPRALNALTHGMVSGISEALAAWERDDDVRAVVISGAGERGLCAGGDIRAIYEDARVGGGASEAFWRDEYRLNAYIARYPKPYVAFMDGIVMGGGVGVSAHGGVRIVTERSAVAMPETGIGLVPDVGGTYLLSRAPGEVGTHLALTGVVVGAADAVWCGLADHFVASDRLEGVRDALGEALRGALAGGLADGRVQVEGVVREVVARFAGVAPEGRLAADRGWIDACYAADTVEEIVDRLYGDGHPAAKEAAETLLTRSPTALKATLASLRRARGLPTLESVLEQEYRASCAALATADLVEGIRAQVIDKDRAPRWVPGELAGVTGGEVERFFLVPGSGDLWGGVR
ncbi:enoyl-CoA hydratase/isomerase family protein [Streptomyces liangshanensis]|uniref:3-hydroxyisobutyryl-CoA hydrolase n=1 Tax=Streptomyces liangshanensis TaxID=2717324 RepID=A0A6G9H6N0_9ACTN|nr:enoyl-CoA hydratase/isomerase family protein [Streptomyces liangshanensis]QIQ05909.1 enoyl-CoA hydratase/isomerase family protein [Streptomyces liangshanensis]